MTLRERIAANRPACLAIAKGDRCTRPDPHGPDDWHGRGAHTWGTRDLPPKPRWLANLQARDLSGYGA